MRMETTRDSKIVSHEYAAFHDQRDVHFRRPEQRQVLERVFCQNEQISVCARPDAPEFVRFLKNLRIHRRGGPQNIEGLASLTAQLELTTLMRMKTVIHQIRAESEFDPCPGAHLDRAVHRLLDTFEFLERHRWQRELVRVPREHVHNRKCRYDIRIAFTDDLCSRVQVNQCAMT